MKRLIWPLMACTVATLIGVCGLRAVTHAKAELRIAQNRIESLEAHNSNLKRQRDAVADSLELAEHELAELAPLGHSEIDPGREAEIRAWLARLKQLRRSFAERPDQQIPEMHDLTDDDWLRIARGTSFADEASTREALAAARSAAKMKFGRVLAQTLASYTQASGGQLPATTSELIRYLSDPADAPALQRYEMTATGKVGTGMSGAIDAIQEISAVDSDNDNRLRISANGGYNAANPPVAWIENFPQMQQQAYQEYARANNGAQAPSLAELLPYFNPPLDFATQQKVLNLGR